MNTMAIFIFLAIFIPALILLLWVLLQDAFVNIGPNQIGLVISRGKPADRGIPPGVHFALRFGRVIEIYPAVELTYLTSSDGATQPDALTFVDPPLPVILGDRTQATIQYTVRFKVTSEGLPIIHTRFGNAGIKGILRDESRRVLLAAFSEESVVRGAAVGPAVAALEARVSERMEQRLGECGFAMSMFNLRGVDFAETGEVIQSALRAREELERERAVGAVRLLRAEQEAQINAKLAGSVSAPTLEYLRIQAMRELIERWDGKFLTPPGSVSLLSDEAPTPRPPQPSEPEQPAT